MELFLSFLIRRGSYYPKYFTIIKVIISLKMIYEEKIRDFNGKN